MIALRRERLTLAENGSQSCEWMDEWKNEPVGLSLWCHGRDIIAFIERHFSGPFLREKIQKSHFDFIDNSKPFLYYLLTYLYLFL